MMYPSKAVEKHYNTLDPFYQRLWGEHLHHGLWKTGKESAEKASEQLIDLIAAAGKIDKTCRVLDIGCRYGATSRYLARKTEAHVTALTPSPSQWEHGTGVEPSSINPRYLLGDFLHNTLPSASYDVVLAIESLGQVADNPLFFKEVARVLKPGGRFVTCLSLSKENPSPWEVKHLLEPICSEGRLPSLGTATDYTKMIESAGFQPPDFQDLSSAVKKTWSLRTFRTLKGLFVDPEIRRYVLNKHSNPPLAKTIVRTWAAYSTQSIRYGLFSTTK